MKWFQQIFKFQFAQIFTKYIKTIKKLAEKGAVNCSVNYIGRQTRLLLRTFS